MAYSVKSKKTGKQDHLHSKEVSLKNGRTQKIFYFSGTSNDAGALDQLPSGYEIMESSLTGLPMLRKKK